MSPENYSEMDFLVQLVEATSDLGFALELHLPNAEAGSPRFMHGKVLELLIEEFRAEGGNFSIYDPVTGLLEVRARIDNTQSASSGLGFTEFAQRMSDVGADKQLRAKSSSYRCLDTMSEILIEDSELHDEKLQSLDISTLEIKQGLSALAVPAVAHGQLLGVIHLDSCEHTARKFSKTDLERLLAASKIISPALFSSILLSSFSNISSNVLEPSVSIEREAISSVCKTVCDTLFVPWVAIYVEDEVYEGRYKKIGSFGSIDKLECQPSSQYEKSRNPTLFQILDRQRSRYQSGAVDPSDFYVELPLLLNDSEDSGDTLQCKLVDIGDEQHRINGFMLVLEHEPENNTASYLHLCASIADTLSLAISANSNFRTRSAFAFDVVSHELQRLLREMQGCMIRQRRDIQYFLKDEVVRSSLERQKLLSMSTLNDAGKTCAELGQAQITNLLNAIGENRTEFGSLIADHVGGTPLIKPSIQRNAHYEVSGSPPLNLHEEINHIIKNQESSMLVKNVSHHLEFDGVETDLIHLEKSNFHIVVGNVIDNAIKYAKPLSSVRIKVTCEELTIRIRVVNVGPFIYVEERSDIFRIRARGLLAYDSMNEGRGFGLWQAREVARLWGGDRVVLAFCHKEPEENDKSFQWARIGFEIELPVDPTRPRTF